MDGLFLVDQAEDYLLPTENISLDIFLALEYLEK